MFSKNLYFFKKNGDFVENFFETKVDFFSCDFDMFYGSIGCATKFHADEIYFFSFYLSSSKVIAFFVK